MFPVDSQGRSARRRRGIWLASWFVVLGLFVGLWAAGGCSSDSTSESNSSRPRGPVTSGMDLLEPAITMMQPEHLGIDANLEQPVGLLNQWRAMQMKKAEQEQLGEPLPEETRRILGSGLSAEAVKDAERDDFHIGDVRHIRTAYLMKAITDSLAKGVDGELNRAQVAFDFVVRNVELVSEEEALPLAPYEILIFGEGTAADRAWVFAELLRQLNQDAVIVKPEAGGADSPWFVGAVAKQQVRLFDPLRSTPVPTELQTSIEEIMPAAIADLSNPKVLASLAGPEQKSLSPELFEKVSLEIIGTPALWSPRLAALQKVLSGENSVVISQNLTSAEGRPASITDRLRTLGISDEVGLWLYPQSRLQGYEEKAELINERWKPFQAPQNVRQREGQVEFGNFSKLQLKTRTEQLKGQLKEAIQGYLRVQLAYHHLPTVDGDVRDLHADAAEDARFWTGVCQMEQGVMDQAANKFGTYVKEAERFASSRHGDHARILLARCQAQLGKTAEAKETLKPVSPNSPAYESAMFLSKVWGQAARSEAPPENPPAETERAANDAPEGSPNQPAVAEKPAS